MFLISNGSGRKTFAVLLSAKSPRLRFGVFLRGQLFFLTNGEKCQHIQPDKGGSADDNGANF